MEKGGLEFLRGNPAETMFIDTLIPDVLEMNQKAVANT